MANGLKILTVLTASEAAQFKKAVQVETGGLVVSAGDTNVQALYATNLSASGNAQVGGNVTVAGNAVLTTVSASNISASGDLVVRDVTLRNAYLSGDAHLQNAYLNSAYLSGSATFIDGVAFNTISGSISSSLAAETVARIAGDAAVAATASTNLNTVSGAFDVRVTALSGAVSSSIAAEALARSNEDLTFLKLDGSRAMTAALNMGSQDITSAKSGSFSGDVTVAGNLQVNGALTYIATTNLDVTDKLVTLAKGAANAAAANGGGIELEGAGASLTYAETGDKWVSNKSFQVASDLFISGASDFSYINVARSAGQYDVDAAIQALDLAVSGAVNSGGNFKSDYNAHRHVATGSLVSGQVILNLTTLGGAEFAAGEISKIALDVMIKESEETGFTNDLVAIKMFVDGADVKVQIDAPATPSAAYRLIAVNEEDIA